MSPPNQYVVGMRGPGQSVIWTVKAPTGVNLATATTRALTATFRRPGGSPLVVTSWSFSSIAAGEMVARYEPDASDFPQQGVMAVDDIVLTIDGVPYDYDSMSEHVFPK